MRYHDVEPNVVITNDVNVEENVEARDDMDVSPQSDVEVLILGDMKVSALTGT